VCVCGHGLWREREREERERREKKIEREREREGGGGGELAGKQEEGMSLEKLVFAAEYKRRHRRRRRRRHDLAAVATSEQPTFAPDLNKFAVFCQNTTIKLFCNKLRKSYTSADFFCDVLNYQSTMRIDFWNRN
jgi:hypothetical protein